MDHSVTPETSASLQASLFQLGAPVQVSVPVRSYGMKFWEARTAQELRNFQTYAWNVSDGEQYALALTYQTPRAV